MSIDEEELKIKILTLGNSSVGKTSFIQRYTHNTFQIDAISTIGNEMQRKIIEINNKSYKVDFHDTQGQERYKAIAVNFIKNADGIILMYDITKQTTFDSVSEWMENIRKAKSNEFPVVLIGNKCDLEGERVITKEEGEELANKYGLSFYETSNKDGTNIEASCLDLVNKAIIDKQEELKKNPGRKSSIKLDKKKVVTKKSGKSKCTCKEK